MAGALLAALRAKGVTAAELRGFARGMRALARTPGAAARCPHAIDIVGTGGDAFGQLQSLDRRGAARRRPAACAVVKHGNRSVSSRAGSADVLEALGFALPLDERARRRVPGRHAASRSCSRRTSIRR